MGRVHRRIGTDRQRFTDLLLTQLDANAVVGIDHRLDVQQDAGLAVPYRLDDASIAIAGDAGCRLRADRWDLGADVEIGLFATFTINRGWD